jgi:DNA processing protein
MPPPFLFAKGDIKKLKNKSIAIVGTRFPTDYGEKVTKTITKDLTANGITIVSGLARGIDSFAHETALKNGETIAVIGNGFKYIYPSENRNLYSKILEKDVIISELPFESRPDRFNFPCRNRIISGLSQGVLIVEANEKSGSLITASHALDQGKEIFAVPGEITNSRASGTNKLIKDGAKIVLDSNDILEELFHLPRNVEFKNKNNQESIVLLDETDKKIFNFIDEKRNVHFEEIVLNFDLNINTMMSILLTLQLKNLIKELPGKFYCIDT